MCVCSVNTEDKELNFAFNKWSPVSETIMEGEQNETGKILLFWLWIKLMKGMITQVAQTDGGVTQGATGNARVEYNLIAWRQSLHFIHLSFSSSFFRKMKTTALTALNGTETCWPTNTAIYAIDPLFPLQICFASQRRMHTPNNNNNNNQQVIHFFRLQLSLLLNKKTNRRMNRFCRFAVRRLPLTGCRLQGNW